MEIVNCKSWEECESNLEDLVQTRIDRNHRAGQTSSPLLYRGQENQDWRLETTLERANKVRMKLSDYHRLICRVKPQIETFTDKDWKVPDPTDFDAWLHKNEDGPLDIDFPAYDYLAYLRHHGFPSPLLDWTRSPYVAAYFAFIGASDADINVSIYLYWESPDGIKGGAVGEATIFPLGPYVKTHTRHFLQQSQYTICAAKAGIGAAWHYEPHEKAFLRNEPDQDVLWKFNIPASERLKVLKILDAHNLNSFSLLGSEDSLMETMALRELYFR